MLLYLRTSKTASSTVNDWCGTIIPATHNIKFLDHGPNEKLVQEAIEKGDHLFTTVRNPFTRAISQWQECIKSSWLPKDTPFEDYFLFDYTKVSEHCHTHNCTLTEYLSPYLCKIKTIIKTEELEKSLRQMEKDFYLPEHRIGFFNKSNIKFNYQEFYTDERIELVLDKYSIDFETFNYSKSIVNI